MNRKQPLALVPSAPMAQVQPQSAGKPANWSQMKAADKAVWTRTHGKAAGTETESAFAIPIGLTVSESVSAENGACLIVAPEYAAGMDGLEWTITAVLIKGSLLITAPTATLDTAGPGDFRAAAAAISDVEAALLKSLAEFDDSTMAGAVIALAKHYKVASVRVAFGSQQREIRGGQNFMPLYSAEAEFVAKHAKAA